MNQVVGTRDPETGLASSSVVARVRPAFDYLFALVVPR
jgi:hypothetical protein